MNDLTFYQLNDGSSGQTTLAAQKVMEIPVENADGQTTQSLATLGGEASSGWNCDPASARKRLIWQTFPPQT